MFLFDKQILLYYDLGVTEAQLDAAEAQLGVAEAQLGVAEAQLGVAEAQLDAAVYQPCVPATLSVLEENMRIYTLPKSKQRKRVCLGIHDNHFEFANDDRQQTNKGPN